MYYDIYYSIIVIYFIYSKYTHTKQKKMKGINNCNWLSVGRRTTCNKSCLFDYCKIHRMKQRQGRPNPKPCKICGKGVQSEIQLCNGCGREKVRLSNKRAKKNTEKHFSSVLSQLIKNRPVLTVTAFGPQVTKKINEMSSLEYYFHSDSDSSDSDEYDSDKPDECDFCGSYCECDGVGNCVLPIFLEKPKYSDYLKTIGLKTF